MPCPSSFQSRYRAAFHFRQAHRNCSCGVGSYVSISLSSGFSFQGGPGLSDYTCAWKCFNLVIERLLISGLPQLRRNHHVDRVSISLSSGFSFQAASRLRASETAYGSFNLVIERLLISGFRRADGCRDDSIDVSISLSSGFSFQD